MDPTIKVGLGVLVYKDGKLLLGKRKGSHGQGEYASPGGSMEFGESIEEAAKREVLEETGLQIDNIQFLFVANLKNYSGKHFLHIQLKSDWTVGEPQVLEPDKCEGWDWYDPKNLPSPMFKTYQYLEKFNQTGQTLFDE